MLRDHRKLRRAPELVLSDRVQHLYPQLVANTVEAMFRVDNPAPEAGACAASSPRERKRLGIRRRDLLRDALDRMADVRMSDGLATARSGRRWRSTT